MHKDEVSPSTEPSVEDNSPQLDSRPFLAEQISNSDEETQTQGAVQVLLFNMVELIVNKP